MNNNYSVLEDVVRQTFATVVWSHKIQEKQGDIESNKYYWMELANIFCASLTAAGVVGLVFSDKCWIKIVTALISFVTIFCTIYLKSFNTQEEIIRHKVTANKLLSIRNNLVALIAEIHTEGDEFIKLSLRHKEILIELDSVYKSAPSTSNRAVKKAKEALVEKEDYTFSDDEIDRFLPKELRKDNK